MSFNTNLALQVLPPQGPSPKIGAVKSSFYQYTYPELEKLCTEQGLGPQSASLLFNWHYKKNATVPCDHQALSKKTKAYLQEHLSFERPKIFNLQTSEDKTVKFLFELQDGKRVESVLIPFHRKYTICLSSQAGCAMKCAFCYTGRQGFSRHLKPEEIIGQFLEAQRWLSENRPGEDRILNVVFMGQGEPLHNFDAVKTACQILLSQHGLSLAAHKITVSTSGYLPGLIRWKNEMPPVNPALSLHSPFAEKREELIPITKKYSIEAVLEALDDIPLGEKRFVTYEYLLIKDYNDSEEDAHATGKLLKGKKAYVNLIPFNSFPGTAYQKPTPEKIQGFKSILEQYQLPTTIRTTKGDEILAACGQLNTALSV